MVGRTRAFRFTTRIHISPLWEEMTEKEEHSIYLLYRNTEIMPGVAATRSESWCSCTMGDRTNIGQILDKCPIIVQVLSNIYPIFAHVQVLSKNVKIFGHLSSICQMLVQVLHNILLHLVPLYKILQYWTKSG